MSGFTTDRRKNRERRIAPREAAEGLVEISFSIPVPTTITALLVERSATGFRASYDAKTLEAGREISYRHKDRQGIARVIWTQVADGHRISGFLLVEP